MLPVLLSIGPVKIYAYGVFLFLALFVGLYWWWKMGRDEHYEEIELFDGYFTALLVFFVGARAAYVVWHPEIQTWYRAFAFLAYPGFYVGIGIALAVLYLAVYARMQQWDIWKVMDMTSVALAVILMIGSIGTVLNGSNPGLMSDWGVVYVGETVKRIPVDAWTFVWSLVTFGIVSRVRKQFRFFAWYKRDASVAKDGLSFLTFLFLGGIYMVLAGLLDDVKWKIGVVPGVSLVGAVVLLLAATSVYMRSGKDRGEDLLQWVSQIGKRR